jgi:arylsulfatase A-like enzyme
MRGRLFGGLLLIGVAACAPDSVGAPPHVVIVVLDTTRADALSSYGNPRPTTPNLDRLAAEGVRFERAYATDFWTLPSHASLFTGLYPSDHGATSETNRLAERADTLAERLQRAGYRTGAFVSNAWLSPERGFSQGFETYVETWRREPRRAQGGNDRAVVEQALAWTTQRTGEPFLLFLNLLTPHLPYSPDPSVQVKVSSELRPLDRVGRLKKIVAMWSHLAGAQSLDALDFEILRELYDAEVATADTLVGKLLEGLRSQGLLDQTLVVVTSDHGENIGEHGMIDHMLSMYETTLRVPLIMRYPRRFAAGSVDDTLVSGVDVFPTVLDICGLASELPEGAGRSLADAGHPAPAYVIAENDRPVHAVSLMKRAFPEFDTDPIDRRMRMLRTERYKLIWYETGDPEIYDLVNDPEEHENLAAARPELLESLTTELRGWMGRHETARRPSPFESEDAEALDQLSTLGYVSP